MNKHKKILKNERGATIIMITVMIMFSILTVAMSLGTVVINGLKVSSNQSNATQAYFAAEAGAEEALWEIRKNFFDPPTGTPSCEHDEYIANDFLGCETLEQRTTQSNGSEFYILFKYPVLDATTTLVNFGEFEGTRRVIQLQY